MFDPSSTNVPREMHILLKTGHADKFLSHLNQSTTYEELYKRFPYMLSSE